MLINCIALLEIAQKVGNLPAHQEIPTNTMGEILQVLRHSLGIERCTFWQIHGPECEITTGIPIEAHGIGKKDELKNHPDIEHVVNLVNGINLIEDPLENPLTAYLRKTIEQNGINAILYILISESGIKGAIVVDATGKKKTFNESEIRLSQTAGGLVAARVVSYDQFFIVLWQKLQEFSLQDLRDELINPLQVIGGYSKRILKKLKEAEKNLVGIDNAEIKELLREAEIIDKEVTRIEKIVPFHT